MVYNADAISVGGNMKKEKNPNQSITHSMMLVTNYSWKYAKNKLKSCNLSKVQYTVCSVVNQYPGISQDGISRTLQMDKSSVAKLIFKLIQLDMIEREVNPEDRREYQIYLTKAGKKAMRDVLSVIREWEDTVFSSVGEEARAQITESLAVLEAAAKKLEYGE